MLSHCSLCQFSVSYTAGYFLFIFLYEIFSRWWYLIWSRWSNFLMTTLPSNFMLLFLYINNMLVSTFIFCFFLFLYWMKFEAIFVYESNPQCIYIHISGKVREEWVLRCRMVWLNRIGMVMSRLKSWTSWKAVLHNYYASKERKSILNIRYIHIYLS